MKQFAGIKTAFPHIHKKPTSKDSYPRRVKVKWGQLQSKVFFQMNHSASKSTAYFAVNNVIVSQMLRILVVGVELCSVEQLTVVQDTNLSRKQLWKHVTREGIIGQIKLNLEYKEL